MHQETLAFQEFRRVCVNVNGEPKENLGLRRLLEQAAQIVDMNSVVSVGLDCIGGVTLLDLLLKQNSPDDLLKVLDSSQFFPLQLEMVE